VFGTPIALTSAGGTGTDPVSYETSGAVCKVTDSSLTATAAGTCVVTATQGDKTGTASFTFTEPSLVMTETFWVSGTTLDGTAGEPIALFLEGKPGSGEVVFTTTTDGCTVSGSSLTRSTPGDCSVYATQGRFQSSKVLRFTFRAPGSEIKVPAYHNNYFYPPPGCASPWRARFSVLGGESRPGMTYTTSYAELGAASGEVRSPFFCGDYWVPGGWDDLGWEIYKSSRGTIEFAGWNSKMDGSGVAYTPGLPTRIPTDRRQYLLVYAQWRTCCTVSFDAGGGSGSMSPMTGPALSEFTLPKVSFTRPGYAARIWYETKASVSMQCVYKLSWSICPEAIFDYAWDTYGDSQLWLNRSYVLQPIWEPAWTVTFDGNGGTLGAAKKMPPEVFWEKKADWLNWNQFSRSGYQFTGWNTESDGTGTAYSQRQRMTPPADITLYAQWSCTNCYTVSFDANGGTGTQLSPLTSAGGSSVTAPVGSGYTRTGQQFAGWNTAANGTGTAYAGGASFIPTANMTLYAVWVAAPSSTVTTPAATVPGAPALTALSRRSKTEAWVTFSAPSSDGGKPITGYTVTVKGPNGRILTQSFPAQAGKVPVGPLNNGGFYTFTVRAVNSVGTSNPSNATRYLNLG
jgi:uncharacterized repeat protein (TIGR02543 family)